MVITNHQTIDGPQEDNRHKIATSSEIDGATCGGDLLSVPNRIGPRRREASG